MTATAPNRITNVWKTGGVRWALFALLLLVGSYLRFTGLNWDEGQWIHPDEGHMRMITAVIHWPDDPALYFDTHQSPLNSMNSGYQYSYGTLPLFLTRFAGEWLDDHLCSASSDGLTTSAAAVLFGIPPGGCSPGTFTGVRSAEVGRALSALADVGTLFLVFLLGRRLYGETVGLVAMALGALTAFTIQQAHFYTVDSTAAFFILMTAYFAVRGGLSDTRSGPSWPNFAIAGLATGLATACKISGFLAGLLVALAGLWWWLRSLRQDPERTQFATLARTVPPLLIAGVLALLAFRIAQPYAFEGPGIFGLRPNPDWVDRLGQISAEQNGEIDWPSGRQWTDRAPILFPWINMVVWGMGIPLGLAAWAGWALAGMELLRGRYRHLVLWTWASVIFFYQATRWVKAMRYFLPLYPILVLLAAYALVRLCRSAGRWGRRVGPALSAVVLLGAAIWGLAVFGIYTRPHPRIAASRWIYAHIPTGATLANEHWDWGLPLRIDGHDPFGGMYDGFEMEHYNEDTPAKRVQLFDWLERADYIILASNRLYGSIPRLPERYPLTTAYYRALFSGRLGFELVADFTSRPSIGPFQFRDQETPFPLMEVDHVEQRAAVEVQLPPGEEAFSVYDHPRVLIFSKSPAYSSELAEGLLGQIDLSQARVGQTPREASSELVLLLHDLRFYAALALLPALLTAVYRRWRRPRGQPPVAPTPRGQTG